ncbi:TNF receptor-associated factor 2-like [Dermacentor andersoni]|uniref:TNF receptor-associated factor 2-like n=1 Tax=Dermacentor andersoni TaxID=34620 RepID=UPI0024163D50|nr:TNF receptor-associated factor 2-like [Dermacentor andersoni]
MTGRKLLVKDRYRTFEDKLVTFAAEVPGRVLCALCGNISSELLADPEDHLYCRPCLGMLDNDGLIDCCVDSATHRIEDMEHRSERFMEALELSAMCPNETCSYQATLREVMGHYKNCKVKTVKCPLCKQEVSTKLLHPHISNVCEERLLCCPFCSQEVAARQLETHMEDCDQRPATCDHCETEFDTFAELRDIHLAVCPSKPAKCRYAQLGCRFQACNQEMEKHVGSCQYVTSLIDRVLTLEAKVQELGTENEQLRQLIAEKEEVYKKKDDYFQRNVQEDLEELRAEIVIVQNRTMQNDPMTEKRLRELEEKHALLETPLEKLLVEIAKAK